MCENKEGKTKKKEKVWSAHLFVEDLSSFVGLNFAESFALFAPLHQGVMKEGL